jgi:hypothetical protein
VRVVASGQREPLRLPRLNVDCQSRASPRGELPWIDIEGAAIKGPEQQIVITNEQLAILKAHREAAITAASRLEEHERSVGGLKAMNRLQRRPGGDDTRRFVASAHDFL